MSEFEMPARCEVWGHYKGGRYMIVGLAIDGCTDRPSVVYVRENKPDDLFVRDLGDWLASVDHNGHKVRRFVKVPTPPPQG